MTLKNICRCNFYKLQDYKLQSNEKGGELELTGVETFFGCERSTEVPITTWTKKDVIQNSCFETNLQTLRRRKQTCQLPFDPQ